MIGLYVPLLLGLLAQGAAPAARGSIEGIVVRATTGEPLADAQVTLQGAWPTDGVSLILPYPGNEFGPIGTPMTTGSNGRFAFNDLRPGTYVVVAVANGYTRQKSGQQVPNGEGRAIFLKAGQRVTDATLRMSPAAAVSGRILDELGQPANGTTVQLVRVSFGLRGRELKIGGTTTTDDRGEYRLHSATPGTYYVVAGTPPGSQGRLSSPQRTNPNQTVIPYEMTFFPGVVELLQASAIDLKPGAEARADMNIRRERFTRVRGRVVDSATGRPPEAVHLSLGFTPLFGQFGSFSPDMDYDKNTGMFELRNVRPGSYMLQAQVQDQVDRTGTASAREGLRIVSATEISAMRQRIVFVPFTLTESGLDNLNVLLNTGATIPGRITAEGRPFSSLNMAGRFGLQLIPTINGAPAMTGPVVSSLPVDPDGNFTIAGVRDFEYRTVISAEVPDGFYVASMRREGVDLLTTSAKFPATTSAGIEVVLRFGTGKLTGIVQDARNQPVPSALVAIVPDNRNRQDLYMVGVTDPNGRFEFQEMPPGTYKVFGWDDIEAGDYYNPEVLKRSETQARAIEIRPSSDNNIEVRLIPVQQ